MSRVAPESRRKGETFRSFRTESAIAMMAVRTPADTPSRSDSADTCSDSSRVPTASTQKVRSPSSASAPYPAAPAAPIRLPTIDNIRPSARKSQPIRLAEKPSARNAPTSRKRCSMPSRKNSPVRTSAEITRKKAEIREILAEVGGSLSRG